METHAFTAFLGTRRLASGALSEVLETARPFSNNLNGPLLIFDHATGLQADFDWREPAQPAAPRPGPGRPKLGVVSTEVTLLPRHWEWLNAQPAKASATLRRLVEDAMRHEASDPKKRLEVLGKILWAVAGNEAGFEEATRALFAGDRARLVELSSLWTGDLPAFVREWE
jgi:hypothetical protein